MADRNVRPTARCPLYEPYKEELPMFLLSRKWAVVWMVMSVLGCANQIEKKPSTWPAVGLERFEYVQVHMGVRARLVVWAKDEEIAVEACSAAYRRVAELEQICTDYRKSSELMQLCAKAGGPAVAVSDELFFVLQRAVEKSRNTGGAFDVTVGPLVALWREARKTGRMPAREEMERE